MRIKIGYCIIAVLIVLNFLSFQDFQETTAEILKTNTELEITDKEILNKMNKLRELGFNPIILEGIKIEVYPGSYIKTYQKGEKQSYITGTYSSSTITIVSEREDVLYHELGHVIEGCKLGVYGYDWTSVNKFGQQYIKLKSYDKELTSETQLELPWEERLSEWFAEDVKQFLAEKLGEESFYRDIGPEKTKDIDKFLEQLIFTEPGI